MRRKGEAVMHQKPFSVILALWPWPLIVWPQSPYSTHGETACEVSLRSVKRGSSYAPETIFSNPCIVTLTFDQKFHRANTWLMGRLNVKFHVDRCKGEAVMRVKPFCLTAQSSHCDLDLWPFDKIPPTATISNAPSYATERGSSYAPETIFSNPCIVTLTFGPQSPYLTHGETACEVSWRSVKRGSSYAPETIFSNPCIVTLTFDQKVHRAHTWLIGRLHVKFHEDRCKGKAVMRLKPFYLTARLQTDGRTDRQTDGQGDSSIPRCGGYNYP